MDKLQATAVLCSWGHRRRGKTCRLEVLALTPMARFLIFSQHAGQERTAAKETQPPKLRVQKRSLVFLPLNPSMSHSPPPSCPEGENDEPPSPPGWILQMSWRSHKKQTLGSFPVVGGWMTVGRASRSSDCKVDGDLGVQRASMVSTLEWTWLLSKHHMAIPHHICHLPRVLIGSQTQTSMFKGPAALTFLPNLGGSNLSLRGPSKVSIFSLPFSTQMPAF